MLMLSQLFNVNSKILHRFVALSCINTGQIIIVYLDAAINVIVYYSRCTLIRESMSDTARTVITVLISPVLMIMRGSRD